MRVLRSLEAWSGGASVVAVGNFDGVHRAHRELLAAVRQEADATGAVAVAVSFDPHPSRVLHPQTAPRLITPVEEKIRQIATTGVDTLLLLPFDPGLSRVSPREFVERVLVHGLRARSVHEGSNFRFGHRHQGTVAALAEWGREFGFVLHLHPEVTVGGAPVSSSRIRVLIEAGEVALARRLLGRPFAVRARVARGRGVGRLQTVPTLNLESYEELLPARGVYLVQARVGDGRWAALTNVGVRPTFGEAGPLTVETHILHPPAGFEVHPGAPLEIDFLRRLRAERRFPSPEALRDQILADGAGAERYFARIKLR